MQPSKHIVFFLHGLFGSPQQFYLFSDLFPSTIIYHACEMYQQGLFSFITGTVDGISEGAERILNDMNRTISENSEIKQISIIAGSLGGLWAREAIGVFYEQNKEKFENGSLEFHSFMTMATPHLGTEQLPVTLKFLSYLTKSTREMTLLDQKPEKLLSLSEGIFFEALSLFKQRVLYTPLLDDTFVSFESSGLAVQFPEGYSELIMKKQSN